MKKNIIIIVLIMFCMNLFSQDNNEELSFKNGIKDTDYQNKNIYFKLSFLFPEIGGEVKIEESFSFSFGAKFNPNLFISVISGQQTSVSFNPQPVIHIEPKWNYNIKRRNEKGKKTRGFSSNFISLYTDFNVKVSNQTNYILLVGPTWGMQRTIGKVGYFGFNTGLGFIHFFNSPGRNIFPISPILDFKLGLLF